MSTSLRVSDLSKTYGHGDNAVQAVRHVSFEVGPGEFVALVGPSGSGKTTLLAMIGGLLTPTSGTIEVNGRDITTLSGRQKAAYRRTSVGYVFQANNLLPFLTARENLLVMGAVNGRLGEARTMATRLLEELGLRHRATAIATELSGGERQRVAIARALMNRPELVLVDEPTANLDSARGKQVVLTLIKEVKARDLLGIMVTHDLAMASLTDRVLEIHDGALAPGRGDSSTPTVPPG